MFVFPRRSQRMDGLVHSGCTEPSPEHTSEQREKDPIDARNIVIFGETGVGKSSIINLIAGQKLAHTSNSAVGCTSQHKRHAVELDGMPYALWDTVGLDEGTEETVPPATAESNLTTLFQDLANSGGIHLLFYCVRGNRLTKALKRNYDLYYVTALRKKVPIALVVTGLERQQGGMETWWSVNEPGLRRYGMWFDAHACVTTLDHKDHLMQQRRSDSQRLLCELVVRYSGLPPLKIDASFMSCVMPIFRTALHRNSMGEPRNTTAMRTVVVCDMAQNEPTESSSRVPVVQEIFTAPIGDRQYKFLQANKHALQTTPTAGMARIGAGLLVFYTPSLLDPHISSTDVDTLRKFYDVMGGQLYPVIVVLRDCDDEAIAQECRTNMASLHSDIHAHFVPLPGAVVGKSDDMVARLGETIERLYIEDSGFQTPASTSGRKWMAGMFFTAVKWLPRWSRTQFGSNVVKL